jgi:2-dehydro-3-deoxygluconokinase
MEKKSSLVCMGELMVRLGTCGYEKIVQANQFEVKFTGAEANVGVSCVNYGLPSYVVSQVPDHDLGQACINYLRRFGLDTTYVFRGGDRLGILYTETGYSQRPSKVIYDRANSSFTQLEISEELWDTILEGRTWFHFCGTAPAQGPKAMASLLAGLKVAKRKGLTVSVDYNFRSKLWSRELARESMEILMEFVDIGIGNEEDCEAIFGICAEGSDYQVGKVDSDSYEQVAKKMVETYNLTCQAITLRESISASRNGWSAIISDGKNTYTSSRYVVEIIDRIGGGDSFSGGLIYSLANKKGYQEAIDFAVAASCLKQTLPGDFNLVTKEEVVSLMNGNCSGRVQR